MTFGLRKVVCVQGRPHHPVFEPDELDKQLLVVNVEVFALLRVALQALFEHNVFEHKELTGVLVVVVVERRLSLGLRVEYTHRLGSRLPARLTLA